jgi:hypothetical protein
MPLPKANLNKMLLEQSILKVYLWRVNYCPLAKQAFFPDRVASQVPVFKAIIGPVLELVRGFKGRKMGGLRIFP